MLLHSTNSEVDRILLQGDNIAVIVYAEPASLHGVDVEDAADKEFDLFHGIDTTSICVM